MDNSQHVSVYWDMSASVSPNVTGFEIVNALRRILKPLGSIQIFKFYVDFSHPGAPKANLTSELQCSGVTVVDTASKGRPNASNKMMIADCLVQMAINPPPSTYVFISGDSDILYTASLLRMRGYKVVILCPEGSGADLQGEADWDDAQHQLFQRVWEEGTKDQAAPGKSTSPMNTPLEAKPGIGIASGEDSYANRPIQPLAKTDDANRLVQDFPSAQSRDDSLHRRSLETVAENAGQGTWAPLVSSSASVLPRLQRPSSAPTSELSLPVYQDSTSPPWKVQEVGSDGWEGNVRSLLDSVRRGGTPAAWTRSAPTSDYGSRQAPSPGPSTMNSVLAVPSQSSSSKSSKEIPPRYKTLVDCLRGFATFSVPRGSLDGELRKIDPNFYANSGLSGVPRPMVNLIEGAYEEGIIASKTGPFVILTYPYRRV